MITVVKETYEVLSGYIFNTYEHHRDSTFDEPFAKPHVQVAKHSLQPLSPTVASYRADEHCMDVSGVLALFLST